MGTHPVNGRGVKTTILMIGCKKQWLSASLKGVEAGAADPAPRHTDKSFTEDSLGPWKTSQLKRS